MMNKEMFEKLSDGAKANLTVAMLIKNMYDDDTIDTEELEHIVAHVIMTCFPTMFVKDKHKDGTECKGALALDGHNKDMVAGFLGGVLMVIAMQGMPKILTDPNMLRPLSQILMNAKRRELEKKLREKFK